MILLLSVVVGMGIWGFVGVEWLRVKEGREMIYEIGDDGLLSILSGR